MEDASGVQAMGVQRGRVVGRQISTRLPSACTAGDFARFGGNREPNCCTDG